MGTQFSRIKKTLSILLAVCFLLSMAAVAVSAKELCNVTEKTAENKMKGFSIDIEKATLENDNYRKVLYTGKHSQLVLMSLKPGEEIGIEMHNETDQFFRFEEGQGKCIINGNEYEVRDGSAIIVPAGAEHNIINTSKKGSLKLYTIYSPAHHKDGIVRATKEEAEANEADFDGVTTE
jgi:mannose-6-phosphate isomerase-like protein (cupin superfamily)